MYKLTLILTLLTLIAFGCTAQAAYIVRSLGVSPGFDYSSATDINDDGIVICESLSLTGAGAFTWTATGGLVDLSYYGIQADVGINSQGQTLGVYGDSSSRWLRPFLRNLDGTSIYLNVPLGIADAWPRAIIDGGKAIVDFDYRNEELELIDRKTALVDSNGSVTYVEYGNGFTQSRVISNNGTVVADGYMWTQSGGLQPLPWLINAGNVDLRGISDSGWVVGMLNGHIMRWDPIGNISDLGSGQAFGINNVGQVVGANNHTAKIWNYDNSAIELPFLEGGSIAAAYAINNLGQVVGEANTADGQRIAVLWETVPEPSSIIMLFGGIIGAGAMWQRKK